MKTARTFDEDYGKHVKIYTDESKMGDKAGYAIVKEEHTIKKRILPQNTVFCDCGVRNRRTDGGHKTSSG
jgi:hypothetical protein